VAVIRDVMPALIYCSRAPLSTPELLQQHGADAWVMAGGSTASTGSRTALKKPKVLVDPQWNEEAQGSSRYQRRH